MFLRLVTALVWLLLLVIIWWQSYLYLAGMYDTNWNYFSNTLWALGYAGAAVTGIYFSRQVDLPGAIRSFLFWSGLGMGSYAIAQGIWTYYNVALGVDSPSVSIGDAFYLSIYIFLAMGLSSLLTFYRPIVTRRLMIETVAIIVICFFFLMWLMIRPLLQDAGSSLIDIAYPVGDSIISSLFFLLLRLAGGKMQRGILIFSAGLACLAMGDTLFILRDRAGTYWNGDISDNFLAAAGICFWLGMIATVKNFLPQYSVETSS